MTHKDHMAIAQVFNDSLPNHAASSGVKELWMVLKRDMADILELDNSRFDRSAFFTVCDRPWSQ
ncbi:MAG: hypothetical protein MN733_00670 [Nitrososphaera sp.]|nr:hypothetical protein [Nitrososphaera sp.]